MLFFFKSSALNDYRFDEISSLNVWGLNGFNMTFNLGNHNGTGSGFALKNGPEETTSILPFILIIGW